MGNGPLDHPQLLAIEDQLDAGNLDDAQRLLADLGDQAPLRHATTYLATRLLYQRGKLTSADVAQRLRELLETIDEFAEAEAMLEAAEAGTLDRNATYKQQRPRVIEGETARPARVSSVPPKRNPLDEVSALPATPRKAPQQARGRSVPNLGIPGPPRVPDVPARTLPPVAPTSEAPAQRPGDTRPSPPAPHESPLPTQPNASDGLELEPPEPRPGFYSSRPPAAEAVHSPKRARASRRNPSSVRARPNVSQDETPTLFSVLGLLDDQRYEEALEALELASSSSSPQFVLMRARALLGLHRREDAVLSLRRLCNAPILEPELRAGCARLLIVADELEMAYEQAKAAHEIDASSPVVRLALAWAAVRTARREDGSDRMRLAQKLLDTIDENHGPTPALALALKACVELDQGKGPRALRKARRALELDPNCVDALAALSLGSARLGRRTDAEHAWKRLLSLSSEEAHALRPLLDRVGVPMDRVRPSLAPASREPVSRRVWHPLEAALVNGEAGALLHHWEDLCQAELKHLPADVQVQLDWLAERAGDLLTRAPGFTHFAPYDFSLWSLLRLQVALDLVYERVDPSEQPEQPGALLVLGAYLGETVRLAHDGYWSGSLDDPDAVRVVTSQGELEPFSLMAARIEQREPLPVDDYLDLGSAHKGELPWSRHRPNPSLPPCPWDPTAGPSTRHLPTIGRALGRSMVSMYCDRYSEGALDYSIESLGTLEAYLALISPPHAPVDEDSPCLNRAGIFVGCYLAEVLRGPAGGDWASRESRHAEHSFRTRSAALSPIEYVMRRLHGEHTLTLTGFAEEAMHDLGGSLDPTGEHERGYHP